MKNCRFFEAGCKVTTSYHFIQIFRSDFEDFFILTLTRTFEELFAFFEADGKDTRSIFITKFFLSLVIHISTLLSACHLQRTYPICHSLYSLFLSPLSRFTGVSVSNRVAKIDSSTSLPNIFISFFLPFSETRYQRTFHSKKTFTASHAPPLAHRMSISTSSRISRKTFCLAHKKTTLISTAVINYQ